MKTVIAERVKHDSGMRVTLRFPDDEELIKIAKSLPDARWSEELKCWHIYNSRNVMTLIFNAFWPTAYVDYSALKKLSPVSPGRISLQLMMERTSGLRGKPHLRTMN